MKLIGYVRVSTDKQGQSGLGLEAQLTAIQGYAEQQQGEIVKLYREVETGTRDDRPELLKALAHAKRIHARLVIAKLDRLARDVHFVSGLTKSGVDFIACDNPVANKLTIHILAAVAEDEAERISQRTKAALQAAKARGQLLGSARPGHWEGREEARRAGAEKGSKAAKAKRDAEALPVYLPAAKVAKQLNDEGASLQEIADVLNEQGLTTLRGGTWSRMQVSRLLNSGLVASLAVAVGTLGAVPR
jgi:DNA invertase Pin-like site-specific DNA recombinase